MTAWIVPLPRPAGPDSVARSPRITIVRILPGLVVALLALAAIGVGACSGSGRQDGAEAERRGSLSRDGELALVYHENNDEATLVRINPRSLRLVGRMKLDLGEVYGFPTFSPDGRLLAFSDVYSYGQVQVVDVKRLRTVARLDVGEESVRIRSAPSLGSTISYSPSWRTAAQATSSSRSSTRSAPRSTRPAASAALPGCSRAPALPVIWCSCSAGRLAGRFARRNSRSQTARGVCAP